MDIESTYDENELNTTNKEENIFNNIPITENNLDDITKYLSRSTTPDSNEYMYEDNNNNNNEPIPKCTKDLTMNNEFYINLSKEIKPNEKINKIDGTITAYDAINHFIGSSISPLKLEEPDYKYIISSTSNLSSNSPSSNSENNQEEEPGVKSPVTDNITNKIKCTTSPKYKISAINDYKRQRILLSAIYHHDDDIRSVSSEENNNDSDIIQNVANKSLMTKIEDTSFNTNKKEDLDLCATTLVDKYVNLSDSEGFANIKIKNNSLQSIQCKKFINKITYLNDNSSLEYNSESNEKYANIKSATDSITNIQYIEMSTKGEEKSTTQIKHQTNNDISEVARPITNSENSAISEETFSHLKIPTQDLDVFHTRNLENETLTDLQKTKKQTSVHPVDFNTLHDFNNNKENNTQELSIEKNGLKTLNDTKSDIKLSICGNSLSDIYYTNDNKSKSHGIKVSQDLGKSIVHGDCDINTYRDLKDNNINSNYINHCEDSFVEVRKSREGHIEVKCATEIDEIKNRLSNTCDSEKQNNKKINIEIPMFKGYETKKSENLHSPEKLEKMTNSEENIVQETTHENERKMSINSCAIDALQNFPGLNEVKNAYLKEKSKVTVNNTENEHPDACNSIKLSKQDINIEANITEMEKSSCKAYPLGETKNIQAIKLNVSECSKETSVQEDSNVNSYKYLDKHKTNKDSCTKNSANHPSRIIKGKELYLDKEHEISVDDTKYDHSDACNDVNLLKEDVINKKDVTTIEKLSFEECALKKRADVQLTAELNVTLNIEKNDTQGSNDTMEYIYSNSIKTSSSCFTETSLENSMITKEKKVNYTEGKLTIAIENKGKLLTDYHNENLLKKGNENMHSGTDATNIKNLLFKEDDIEKCTKVQSTIESCTSKGRDDEFSILNVVLDEMINIVQENKDMNQNMYLKEKTSLNTFTKRSMQNTAEISKREEDDTRYKKTFDIDETYNEHSDAYGNEDLLKRNNEILSKDMGIANLKKPLSEGYDFEENKNRQSSMEFNVPTNPYERTVQENSYIKTYTYSDDEMSVNSSKKNSVKNLTEDKEAIKNHKEEQHTITIEDIKLKGSDICKGGSLLNKNSECMYKDTKVIDIEKPLFKIHDLKDSKNRYLATTLSVEANLMKNTIPEDNGRDLRIYPDDSLIDGICPLKNLMLKTTTITCSNDIEPNDKNKNFKPVTYDFVKPKDYTHPQNADNDIVKNIEKETLDPSNYSCFNSENTMVTKVDRNQDLNLVPDSLYIATTSNYCDKEYIEANTSNVDSEITDTKITCTFDNIKKTDAKISVTDAENNDNEGKITLNNILKSICSFNSELKDLNNTVRKSEDIKFIMHDVDMINETIESCSQKIVELSLDTKKMLKRNIVEDNYALYKLARRLHYGVKSRSCDGVTTTIIDELHKNSRLQVNDLECKIKDLKSKFEYNMEFKMLSPEDLSKRIFQKFEDTLYQYEKIEYLNYDATKIKDKLEKLIPSEREYLIKCNNKSKQVQTDKISQIKRIAEHIKPTPEEYIISCISRENLFDGIFRSPIIETPSYETY